MSNHPDTKFTAGVLEYRRPEAIPPRDKLLSHSPAMNHTFPAKVTAHVVTFANGHSRNILVAPSETFGKALARMGYSADDVKSVTLINAPLDYEPDYSIASR